jgi:predicted RNA-binding protein YlxR (DUF448 family)
MASKRPEYFYHPAVGIISPASLDLFRLNAAKAPLGAPPAAIIPPSFTALPVELPSADIPSIAIPSAETRIPESAFLESSSSHPDDGEAKDIKAEPVNIRITTPVIPAPRKLMTLSRTETCVVTGESVPLPDLIRFVVSPDKEIVPDLAEKLPGQYFYIKADLAILQKSIWRNSFASIARDNVTVPKNLIELIESGLSRMAMETLSLARRAGQLVSGFASVEEQLRKEAHGVYVVAADASDHGRYKLAKQVRSQTVLDLWTSVELSAALGEANTNHLLLTPGGLAEKLLRIAKKLKAVRSDK